MVRPSPPPPHATQAADPVPAVQAVLRSLPSAHRAWLFGSRSRGDHLPRADCDIAIDAPDASTREWTAILEALDQARTLIPLDIVRLQEADAALREEILRTGRIIHERG